MLNLQFGFSPLRRANLATLHLLIHQSAAFICFGLNNELCLTLVKMLVEGFFFFPSMLLNERYLRGKLLPMKEVIDILFYFSHKIIQHGFSP